MFRRARLQIKYIKSRDKTILESVDVITKSQLDLITPKNLNPGDTRNYIKTLELSLENVCTGLEEAGITNPKELTVFEFYAKIHYFETKKKAPQPPRKR